MRNHGLEMLNVDPFSVHLVNEPGIDSRTYPQLAKLRQKVPHRVPKMGSGASNQKMHGCVPIHVINPGSK